MSWLIVPDNLQKLTFFPKRINEMYGCEYVIVCTIFTDIGSDLKKKKKECRVI